MRTTVQQYWDELDPAWKRGLIAGDGRFVLTGELYDLWHRTPIRTPQDVDRFANRVDIRRLGLELDALATLRYGTGPEEVVIFIDPLCPHCHRTLAQAAVLLATTALGGCAGLMMGSNDYACRGVSEGMSCLSVKELYAATEQADQVAGGRPAQPAMEAVAPTAPPGGEVAVGRHRPFTIRLTARRRPRRQP